jgi:hypothetical protein
VRYESAALPTELRRLRRNCFSVPNRITFSCATRWGRTDHVRVPAPIRLEPLRRCHLRGCFTLHRCSTSVAEYESSRASVSVQSGNAFLADTRVQNLNRFTTIRRMISKTKRPPGNWAASSSRENSSNGGLDSVKTFCGNLMSRKTGVSSDFWEINTIVFNNLGNGLTQFKTVPN